MLTRHRIARDSPPDRALRLARLTALALPAMDQAAVAGVQLYLLGLPRLQPLTAVAPASDGVAPGAHALERKDAALLALLAVDGPAPRARLAALLWPDVDDDKARNNLRQRLFRLRRLAGSDLVTGDNVLRLADGVAHDLAQLAERLAEDADAGSGELLGPHDYEDAAELADWVGAAREHWRTARRHALADVAARHEAEGHVAQALPFAERLVQDDPLREHAHRRLMRLHYLRGDRAAALAVYERLCELLKRELGTAPDRESRELAQLVEASGALPQPAPLARPVTVLRPPRLVGREADWRALQAALDARRCALVLGEPGIGKSRLIGDFVRDKRGAAFGARPGDARVPFASLARLVRALVQLRGRPREAWVLQELARIAPELETSSGKLDPLRLRQGVAAALDEWRAGGLQAIALDDLQFADEATLEMLPSLVADTSSSLGWIVGARAGELPALVEQWARAEAGAECIELAPLTREGVAELLASLALPGLDVATWAAALVRHTGGNPMYILETLRAVFAGGARAAAAAELKLPAPQPVGVLIEQRLTRLSPVALKLARVAGIAGQDFSAHLAARVLGMHALDLAEPWRELEAAQIVRDNAFAHDLIFEATMRSIPEPIAQVLHAEIADYLEETGGAPARIGRHWAAAGKWSKAGVQYRKAAQIARDSSQRQQEASLLELAVECFERGGDKAEAFEGMHALVIPSVIVSASRMPLEWIERLLALAGTDHERAETLRLKAIVHQARGEYDVVIDTMRAVIELAHRAGDQRVVCSATGTMAVALATIGRGEEAIAAMAPFRAFVLAHEDEDARAEYFAEMGNVFDLADRREDAVGVLTMALESARLSGTVTHQVAILRILAQVSMYMGRIGDALEYGNTAIAARAVLGEARGIMLVTDMNLGWCLRETGRYAQAHAALDAAAAAFYRGSVVHWLVFAENLLAQLWLDLGQPARAMQALTQVPGGVPPFILALRHLVQSQIARATGSPHEAALAQAQAVLASGFGRSGFRILIEIERARDLPPEAAAAHLQRLAQEARRAQYFGFEIQGLARASEALVRTAPQVAASLARQYLLLLEGCNSLGIYPPELWRIAAQAFGAVGDATASRRALEHARDWIYGSALPDVPEEFRDSFLTRNATNRAILTALTRRVP